MKSRLLKKLLHRGIIASLVISLAFTSSVYGLEKEQTQAYEESADSWRYQNGELLRENGTSAPLLFASGNAWEWSETAGGYLSSDGTVIEGAVRKGVDVSSWQGEIDWAKVKAAGIDFAIIRCGYGDNLASQDDKYWLRNVEECEANDIPYGVYIYSYAEKDRQAVSEANHVLRLLNEAGASPDYPIYYDLEDKVVQNCGRNAIIRRAKIFCEAIEAEGYRAGIYASLSWWNKYLNDSSLDKYEKWIAQWNNVCQYEGSYRIWQCTSSGKVSGIDGRVDVNFEMLRDDTDFYMGGWTADENGNKVFQKPDGTIACSEWIIYNGSKVYVDDTGQKADGFVVIGENKYFFKNGILQKNQWIKADGQKYYASVGGKLLTGYKKVGNYYYGFDSEGIMLTGSKTIDGKKYRFGQDGKARLFKVKTTTRLNYRKGPAANKKYVGTFKKGKTVNIIRKENGWGQMPNGYWIKLSYTKRV